MPQPTLPPTPAPSTDIKPRQDEASLQSDSATFDLPPAAMSNHDVAVADLNGKPQQPARTPSSLLSNSGQAGRRGDGKDHSGPVRRSLPPPPARSRKIIQVKPKPRSQKNQDQPEKSSSPTTGMGGRTKRAAVASESKKRQASGTSSGRKIARKTAHSLIERRRRSKMNEEFGVLKDMIPACAGQDMHKLAILQASIDYVRYLKKCLEDIPGSNGDVQLPVDTSGGCNNRLSGHLGPRSGRQEALEEEPEGDESFDEEMEVDVYSREGMCHGPERRTGYEVRNPAPNVLSPTSPPASVKSAEQRPFSSASRSELPSPCFSAGFSHERVYGPCEHSSLHSQSAQTSPALLPQSRGSLSASDLDHEASTALLMLNARDRRDSAVGMRMDRTGSVSNKSGHRSISVKDLLRS